MRHISLFSGIGGFDLAAEWMGWENIAHCEINPFCKQILNYYWPYAESLDNIKTTDFTRFRGKCDILTGGFPCQPYSVAGQRKGKEDDRHLWPEMLRAICEIQPTWIVGENVGGIVSWNGGMVFDEVQAELEAKGYEVQPFILPACAVNAPHRRDRVWFIAYSDSFGNYRNNRNEGDYLQWHKSADKKQQGNGRTCEVKQFGGKLFITDTTHSRCGGRQNKQRSIRKRQFLQGKCGRRTLGHKVKGCGRKWVNSDSTKSRYKGLRKRKIKTYGYWIASNAQSKGSPLLRKRNQKKYTKYGGNGCNGYVTNANSARRQKLDFTNEPNGKGYSAKHVIENWENWPTQSPICQRNDGISERLDGITFPKWRNESIKGFGNAVVPQVVFEIFKVINTMNKNNEK